MSEADRNAKVDATEPLTIGAAAVPEYKSAPFIFESAWLELPDTEMLTMVWAGWLAYQAAQKGIAPGEVDYAIAENIREATLGIDTDAVRVFWLEKALKIYAGGDEERAARLFRSGMADAATHFAALDESQTGRRRQVKNARKPRPDPLNILIKNKVSKQPDITLPQLTVWLHKIAGDGRHYIDEIDENGLIHFQVRKHDKKTIKPAKLSGLKDRLSREKNYRANRLAR